MYCMAPLLHNLHRKQHCSDAQVGDCYNRFQGVRSLWVARQKVLSFTEISQHYITLHHITSHYITLDHIRCHYCLQCQRENFQQAPLT